MPHYGQSFAFGPSRENGGNLPSIVQGGLRSESFEAAASLLSSFAMRPLLRKHAGAPACLWHGLGVFFFQGIPIIEWYRQDLKDTPQQQAHPIQERDLAQLGNADMDRCGDLTKPGC